jgi:hypothetical protein
MWALSHNWKFSGKLVLVRLCRSLLRHMDPSSDLTQVGILLHNFYFLSNSDSLGPASSCFKQLCGFLIMQPFTDLIWVRPLAHWKRIIRTSNEVPMKGLRQGVYQTGKPGILFSHFGRHPAENCELLLIFLRDSALSSGRTYISRGPARGHFWSSLILEAVCKIWETCG